MDSLNNSIASLNDSLIATPSEQTVPFVDRRDSQIQRKSAGIERRQFTNSFEGLSPDAAELGRAIDLYKLNNRRRFINYEEMLQVIRSLGYNKS